MSIERLSASSAAALAAPKRPPQRRWARSLGDGIRRRSAARRCRASRRLDWLVRLRGANCAPLLLVLEGLDARREAIQPNEPGRIALLIHVVFAERDEALIV